MAPVQKEEMLHLRISSQLKEACQRAADEAGITLSDWCRQIMQTAASDRRFALPKKGGRGKSAK